MKKKNKGLIQHGTKARIKLTTVITFKNYKMFHLFC